MNDAPNQHWAAIYREHRRALFGMALNILGCHHLAEDAVQEGFSNLCRQRHGPSPHDPLAYAYMTVRNAALNQRRRQRMQKRMQSTLFNGFLPVEPVQDSAQTVAADDQLTALATTVQRLSTEQRELILLKIHGNLTFAQMGQLLGLPLKTVASRYRRTLQELKESLEENQ